MRLRSIIAAMAEAGNLTLPSKSPRKLKTHGVLMRLGVAPQWQKRGKWGGLIAALQAAQKIEDAR